ncbi:Fe-S cluster domain-containing protein [Pelotomaculum terephthalicicum JT]|uniref:RnfABCDGE type electron transport complex subunit B n=1 Tax=Pelotomaculum TaxID=191373 RepID=UPI0009D4C697|nr:MULTISPECIES: Fe-S cluster domain-containing protein [Pelotomaculum]MCG9967212.1 Fe-S cluster domain-containing protein [Pelotomaculum terephthalicicum JT]OPX91127.1 MAG: Electron transport complex protein rnfB [Pelotomaculum sp. PtaB.Bin117]OPY61545.1 MAG: Electron transport complex protein rnfB [Pelotomaculum sp. PtaU1.Bin065]
MQIALMVLVVMLLTGVVFGLILAFANKKFAIEVNPLIHLVEDALPKGQCGACGYAGCMAYAEAVVLNADVPPNLCVPGKAPVAKIVGELTGKAAAEIEPRIAHVRCSGSPGIAVIKYQYGGIEDCAAANLLQGGQKNCQYGCLGFGTCVKNCPFGAMTMLPSGLPYVDPEKCTGCGKCESVCPKGVIQMLLIGAKVSVNCNSKDKGAVAKKNCSAACLGCGLCKKNCEHDAIKIQNSLAVVDHKICIEKCDNPTCIAKCPTKAIEAVVKGSAAEKVAV